MRVCHIIHLLALTVFLFIAAPSMGADQFKKVEIQGLEIIGKADLVRACSLDRIPRGASSFKQISNRIVSYYNAQGYIFCTVYRVSESTTSLVIFVDEGNIGKIVFHGLSDITLIRVKTSFDLPHRIYHQPTIEREISRLKKKYKYKDFKVQIAKAPNYSESLFQLDGIYQIPILKQLFSKGSLPFFERYGYRYNLDITAIPYTRNEANELKSGLTFSMQLFYLGIKPEAKYTIPSLLFNHDRTEFRIGGGISYLTDFKVDNPPVLGFIESGVWYTAPPLWKGYLTPRAGIDFYYSHGARPDIGLAQYDFIRLRPAFEPGFSFLSALQIFPGVGLEKVYIFNSKVSPDHPPRDDLQDDTRTWFIASIRMKLEQFFGELNPAFARATTIKYEIYYNKDRFYALSGETHLDFRFPFQSIYTIEYRGMLLTGKVPFYHDEPVAGAPFRGFAGRGIYTKRISKIGQEIRGSIYRDYLFAGPFFDMAFFKGIDDNLHGLQTGIVGGIAGHLIFFDQFEFSAYFGRDYLFSNRQKGVSLTFTLTKKY
jgi:hypothetical protein